MAKEKLSKAAIAKAKVEWGPEEDTKPRRKLVIDQQIEVKLPTVQEKLAVTNDRSPEAQARNEKAFNESKKKAGKPAKKLSLDEENHESRKSSPPPKKAKAKKKVENTATPAAQKLADEHGILIDELNGGEDNRVGLSEVKAAVEAISG